ncbi:MAG: hypothetical protein LBP32_03530 [Spirochaetaceae bacterium]|jgi:hypothetical protein|nr:hypothetical protein [Spirochaetaceae bacterium]
MGYRKYTPLWCGILLLIAVPALPAAEESGMLTNAAGGIFSMEQQIWFSVPAGNRLRLVLNGEDHYQGEGPASLRLEAPLGEERSFEILAERRSFPPEDRVLEIRSFLIYIDRKAPNPPAVALRTGGDGFVTIWAKPEKGVRVSAAVDYNNTVLFIPDVGEMQSLPPASYAAVVWAVDTAGNSSDPAPVFLDFPLIRIENPIPGNWANRQRLVLYGAENKRVLWTDDGSDPLGPQGRSYTGPVLIDKTGEVTLRVAYAFNDGRLHEETVVYRVTLPPEDPAESPPYANFRTAEENPIRSETTLQVPPDRFWSVGGLPRHPGGVLTLRPAASLTRMVPVHLSGDPGIYRFVFVLEGTGITVPGDDPDLSGKDRGEHFLSISPDPEGRAGGAGIANMRAPKLIQAGAGRALVFPRETGLARYVWEGDSIWEDGTLPVVIPPEGGVLRWAVDRGTEVLGPFILRIDPLYWRAERIDTSPKGRFAYRYVFQDRMEDPRQPASPPDWHYVSNIRLYEGGSAVKDRFDVCDGEDIEWRFISPEGEALEKWRRDRLSPHPPRIGGIGEGAWSRGPVRIDVSGIDGEEPVRSFITVHLRYASGKTETRQGSGTLVLRGDADDLAHVRIEARLEDLAGNRSLVSTRNFILDPLTIYVSSTFPAAAGNGDRDRPFSSLDEALALAQKEGRKHISLAGSALLRWSAEITRDIIIDGAFDRNWEPSGDKALILIPGDVVFRVSSGALTLKSLTMEKQSYNGGPELFRVRGALEIRDSVLTHIGPLARIDEGGQCRISGARVSSLLAREERIPLIDAGNARVWLTGSSFSLEGSHGLILNMKGGILKAEESVFHVQGRHTGTVFNLSALEADLKELRASVSAADYGSVLELSDSRLTLIGGSFSAAARDGVVLVADAAEALILGVEFRVASSFVARAMEIRNQFPSVTDCHFSFTGSARNSEVFSGIRTGGSRTEALSPVPGSIAGNVFQGFSHILGAEYPAESLRGFNREFAPPGRPNRVSEIP